MSKRNPRTAHPSKSIWRPPLEEDSFRRNLVTLEERTNAVPIAPLAFDADVWMGGRESGGDGDHILPLKVEQQLADEFASLAAVEEGAQSVAAVCVEEVNRSLSVNPMRDECENRNGNENEKQNSLRLRFAALDTTLDSNIKLLLLEISALLCQFTSSEEECVEAIFEKVLTLHKRRLLARLRSKKWEKPKYLAKSHKKALWKDFENLKHRTQFLYSKKEKSSLSSILASLDFLAKIYADFEEIEDEGERLRDLVIKSYEFSVSGEARGYLKRLEDSVGKVATSQVSSAIKSLRQIQKIGSYRRICYSLVNISRAYKMVFEGGIEMEFLSGYEGVQTSVGYESWAGSMHVHAEIQLCVFYDLLFQSSADKPSTHAKPDFPKPRAIGISKSLCFLCFQFLQKHKGFFPSRTHGRLYDQWTVPDLEEFSEETVKKYTCILGSVDAEVRGLIEDEPEGWRVEPMTSLDVYFSEAANT
ncbi:hypothetical protein HYFRA_00000387 [Hymenoscyphus fraxineus]|uniref:Uncharacterized protein n=1 Tax=Hymenoscyphus fraxineus TaxID=746836 RepID=A0A9N9PWQ4_9HELO|nr:hypothetical protein HYFRA_00000387 [Hymenoscyphus fraxineus]